MPYLTFVREWGRTGSQERLGFTDEDQGVAMGSQTFLKTCLLDKPFTVAKILSTWSILSNLLQLGPSASDSPTKFHGDYLSSNDRIPIDRCRCRTTCHDI